MKLSSVPSYPSLAATPGRIWSQSKKSHGGRSIMYVCVVLDCGVGVLGPSPLGLTPRAIVGFRLMTRMRALTDSSLHKRPVAKPDRQRKVAPYFPGP